MPIRIGLLFFVVDADREDLGRDIFRLKLGVIPVLLGCSAAGMLAYLALGPLL